MHIALDARMMGAANTRGIGRYIEETVRAVLEVDHDLRYTLVVRHLSDSCFIGHPRVDHVTADIPWYSLAEQFQLPKILKSIGADLVHVPHWNVSLCLKVPFVITAHDVLLLQQPASAKTSTKGPFTRFVKHMAFTRVLRHALSQARQVFVPTRFVGNDITRLTSTDANKIMVTGEGVTHFSAFDDSIVPSTPYILYVGSAYPHKRLDLLLSGWKKVANEYPNHKLIIAGELDVFMSRLKKENASPNICFADRVSDAQLASLYKDATCFVFPSSHEGFGLPPLEALSLGCPVVASDIACLKEVLPKAGVEWFRDGVEHDMIEALKRTLNDLSHAKHVASEAHDWILTQHDWKTSAKQVIIGYQKALEMK